MDGVFYVPECQSTPGAAGTIPQAHGRSVFLEQSGTASESAKVNTLASASPGSLDDMLRVMRPFSGNSIASNEPSSSMPLQRSSKPSRDWHPVEEAKIGDQPS